jgi:dipeptidyl-peptidase-4
MQRFNDLSLGAPRGQPPPVQLARSSLFFSRRTVTDLNSVEASSKLNASDYARAERFLAWNYRRYVINADIRHCWIGDSEEFWYRRVEADGGQQFVVVDAATGTVRPAFDHTVVAAGLAKGLQREIRASALPFDSFRYTADRGGIEFLAGGALWACDLASGRCTPGAAAAGPGEVISPDGRWAAFLSEHNLWVRPTDGGEAFALTQDGIWRHGYGTLPGIALNWLVKARLGMVPDAQLIWSPDSRRLLSYRLDEREVKEAYLIQAVPGDGGLRPKLHSFPYAMPGDEAIPLAAPVVFDLQSRCQIDLKIEPWEVHPLSPLQAREAWWADDSEAIFLIHRERGAKVVTCHWADPTSGEVREIVRETSATFVQLKPDLLDPPVVETLKNGDVIWYSERADWGNLYLYDGATGVLKNSITEGDWNVRAIVHMDEALGRLYFTASGREPGDPGQRYLYSIGFDGSDLCLLTPEQADHSLPYDGLSLLLAPPPLTTRLNRSRFCASGRYFVDTYSRPDLPPTFVVRKADGECVKVLEKADISKLEAGGYYPVEPFQVLAADGTTPVYGNLFRPSTFDPSKKYAVIESIYPGPNLGRAAKSFGGAVYGTLDGFLAHSLAELGFIVVTVDGRGTPLRSKAFLDYAYGRPDKASDLDDHIAALHQLADRYPSMDLDRVGMEGLSGGGYATAHALLAYPDFYKVGVSFSGNHEQRDYMGWFWEQYIGPVGSRGYETASNIPLAGNLEGKLLLVTGDLDENVHPTMTLKLVDALIKANRDFDLLVVPNAGHAAGMTPYVIRRQWDYFVRYLMKAEPPDRYQIGLI